MMRKLWLALALVVLLVVPSSAQHPVTGLAGGAISASTATSSTGFASQSFLSRFVPDYDPRDYSGVGNGVAHTALSVLGPTCTASPAAMAACSASVNSQGANDLAWANQDFYGLTFAVADNNASTGSVISYPNVSSNSATVPTGVADNYAAQADVILAGMLVTSSGGSTPNCVQAGTTVQSVQYGRAFSISTYLIQPSAGTSVPMPFTGGIVAGEGVSGTNIPTGATVASVANFSLTLDAGHPTTTAIPARTLIYFAGINQVNLSQALASGGCAANTTIRYTYSATMLGLLDMDKVGMQSAVYAASLGINSGNQGGAVHIPGGVWNIGSMVAVPPLGGTQRQFSVEVYGDGFFVTQLLLSQDLGLGGCAFGAGNRDSVAVNYEHYHDFYVHSSANSSTLGVMPVGMDGVCLGGKARAENIRIDGFRAGVAMMDDHQTLNNVGGSYNYFGAEQAANSNSGGNQHLIATDFSSTLASISAAWNSGFDSSQFDNVHLGFSPYAYYKQGPPSGATITATMLTNSTLNNVSTEGAGNGRLYDEAANLTGGGLVENNVTNGGGQQVVTASYSTRLSSQGAYAVDYIGSSENNHTAGADLSAGGANYSSVSLCLVYTGGSNFNNTFAGAAASTPFTSASTTVPVFCGGYGASGNSWDAGGVSSRTAMSPLQLASSYSLTLSAWFSTDQITGATDAAHQSSLPDLSGAGNTFTQATGANQPTYNSSRATYVLPLGSPVLGFNGSYYMGSPASMSGAVSFCVAGQRTVSSGTTTPMGANVNGGLEIFVLNGNQLQLGIGGSSPGFPSTAQQIGLDTKLVHVYCATYANPGLYVMSFDGTQYTGTATPTTSGSPTLNIGAGYYSSNPWTGTLTEGFVFSNVLTAPQLQFAANYLMNKYGTAH